MKHTSHAVDKSNNHSQTRIIKHDINTSMKYELPQESLHSEPTLFHKERINTKRLEMYEGKTGFKFLLSCEFSVIHILIMGLRNG